MNRESKTDYWRMLYFKEKKKTMEDMDKTEVKDFLEAGISVELELPQAGTLSYTVKVNLNGEPVWEDLVDITGD